MLWTSWQVALHLHKLKPAVPATSLLTGSQHKGTLIFCALYIARKGHWELMWNPVWNFHNQKPPKNSSYESSFLNWRRKRKRRRREKRNTGITEKREVPWSLDQTQVLYLLHPPLYNGQILEMKIYGKILYWDFAIRIPRQILLRLCFSLPLVYNQLHFKRGMVMTMSIPQLSLSKSFSVYQLPHQDGFQRVEWRDWVPQVLTSLRLFLP